MTSPLDSAFAESNESAESSTIVVPAPSEPVLKAPATEDYEVSAEELEFRRRPEWHRRTMRCPQPPITQERLEELEALNAEGRIRPVDAIHMRLATRFGVPDEKGLQAMRDADAKRARKDAKRLEQVRRVETLRRTT